MYLHNMYVWIRAYVKYACFLTENYLRHIYDDEGDYDDYDYNEDDNDKEDDNEYAYQGNDGNCHNNDDDDGYDEKKAIVAS